MSMVNFLQKTYKLRSFLSCFLLWSFTFTTIFPSTFLMVVFNLRQSKGKMDFSRQSQCYSQKCYSHSFSQATKMLANWNRWHLALLATTMHNAYGRWFRCLSCKSFSFMRIVWETLLSFHRRTFIRHTNEHWLWIAL